MDNEINGWVRVLTASTRYGAQPAADGEDVANDATVAATIFKLHQVCASAEGPDLLPRVIPGVSRAFQRTLGQANPTAHSLTLLLKALEFHLKFADEVGHDGERSVAAFFRSFLARRYADWGFAEASMKFLSKNREKLLAVHPLILPQTGFRVGDPPPRPHRPILFSAALPQPPGPAYSTASLVAALAMALEDYERSVGPLPGGSPSLTPSPPAPEDVLALMEAAYTGNKAKRRVGGEESGDEVAEEEGRNRVESFFQELIIDENEGLTEGHWANSDLPAALMTEMGSATSARVEHAISLVPRLMEVYAAVAVRDVTEDLLASLLTIMLRRSDSLFPHRGFRSQVSPICLRAILAVFERSPHLVAELAAELALHLCWAAGEHGGGGLESGESARILFESLELVLYETLAATIVDAKRGPIHTTTASKRRGKRSRLLCFGITALAKLATWHRQLAPRALVCLGKVVRSKEYVDAPVWVRARDQLRILEEPSLCTTLLWPTREGEREGLDICLPAYLLRERQGVPFHDASLKDVLGTV